ncbi:hypothetical protein MSHI_08920 [Mycobacterium shinjukuense]|uniref:Uncharacterized protein n=1 Tax=Mycobacterium shinjukuense TaxID=398694 RepID=A0A7I7MLD8_9MYCO|nr:hypothetical protein MSHI_08920 [Mycobacterium shinjukuense]
MRSDSLNGLSVRGGAKPPIQTGDRKPRHRNLGQLQLLRQVDSGEVDAGGAGVHVEAGDDARGAECAGITEQHPDVDDVGGSGRKAARPVEGTVTESGVAGSSWMSRPPRTVPSRKPPVSKTTLSNC